VVSFHRGKKEFSGYTSVDTVVTAAYNLALLVQLLWTATATPPDPTTLLHESIQAEKENRKRSFNYVWREEIMHAVYSPPGELVQRDSATYEVLFVEGETYHRLVARNGKPLDSEETALEQKKLEEVAAFRRKTPIEERRRRFITAEGRRLTFTYRLLAEHHKVQLLGEEVFDGRPAWIIEAEPHDAPKPHNRKEWAYVLRCKLWIDQSTLLPLRMEYTQVKDWDNIPAGSVTEVYFTPVDDVWLAGKIVARQEVTKGNRVEINETKQVYSQFHKFAADSIIRWGDPDFR